MSWLLRFCLFLAVSLSLAFASLSGETFRARAQQTVASASLSGWVQDPNGSIVKGALVTATKIETNQQRTVTSRWSRVMWCLKVICSREYNSQTDY